MTEELNGTVNSVIFLSGQPLRETSNRRACLAVTCVLSHLPYCQLHSRFYVSSRLCLFYLFISLLWH